MVAGLAASQAVHAQQSLNTQSTGWQLYNYCQNYAEQCTTYLAGVWGGYAEAVKIAQVLHPERPAADLYLCPATEVPGEQMRLIYLNYAAAHPERLTYAAGDEALIAMATAFPCRKS